MRWFIQRTVGKGVFGVGLYPNDIYSWQKPTDATISAEHPLHELVPKPQSLDMVQQLQELPLERLEAIRKFIEELPKE